MKEVLFTINDKDNKDLVSIFLKREKAPFPFENTSGVVPGSNGELNVYLENSPRYLQIAARIISSYGLFNFKIINESTTWSIEEAYSFLMGLYDGKNDFNIEIPVKKDDLLLLKQLFTIALKARVIADSDSKTITPASLVSNAFNLIKECASGADVSLDLIKRGDKEFVSLAGLNAVGSGSLNDPCLGVIDICPKGASKSDIKIGLIGKGITFDSGGYNIKPTNFMATMRTDKCGAVYIAAAAAQALVLGLKEHIRLYLCCSENLLSATSMLPGDILNYKNGVNVEINNTDAEGRLVLADGLIRACEDNCKTLLSAATLTGAAKIAVGRDATAVLAPDNLVFSELKDGFSKVGDYLWQLPYFDCYKRFIKSNRATILNSSVGDGAPGASTALAFLSNFTESKPWNHLDLSSAYMVDASPFYASGATAAVVLPLAYFIVNHK